MLYTQEFYIDAAMIRQAKGPEALVESIKKDNACMIGQVIVGKIPFEEDNEKSKRYGEQQKYFGVRIVAVSLKEWGDFKWKLRQIIITKLSDEERVQLRDLFDEIETK